MASQSREQNEKKRYARLVRRHKLALFAVAMLCVCLVFSIVNTQLEIYKQKKALAELMEKINETQLENDELSRVVYGEDEEAYIERVAREKLGYAAVGERVFEDVSGTDDG